VSLAGLLPQWGLAGQGGGALGRFGDRLKEGLRRGAGLPGFVASRVLAEFREPINRSAAMFVGDVLAYLHDRGDTAAIGTIARRFLSVLRKARTNSPADEPLIVVSHSMGGQIVYDALTTFIPEMPEFRDLRIDFWCATASQVALFEELKLFLASSDAFHSGTKVPFPNRKHLGGWWNVWDHNDFISYTAQDIFDGVDDESFDTGRSILGAHSGYLTLPSFYRRFANKLSAAADSEWYR
jgi:hypothetical protein